MKSFWPDFLKVLCILVGAGTVFFSIYLAYGLLFKAPVELLGPDAQLLAQIVIVVGLLNAIIGVSVSIILFVLALTLKGMSR